MEQAEVLIAALLVAVVGLSVLASRLSVPYPIVLVIGGALFGLIPGLPQVQLDPELVLVLFLPPLLYKSSFFSSRRGGRGRGRNVLDRRRWTAAGCAELSRLLSRWRCHCPLSAVHSRSATSSSS
jgi:Sodium/hydrogen exchanger family